MRRKIILSVACLVLLLAGTGALIRRTIELHRRRNDATAVAAATARLREQVAAAEKRRALAAEEHAAHEQQLALAKAELARARQTASQASATRSPAALSSAIALIGNDPAKLKDYMQAMRGAYDLRYGDLMARLGLSPEQREKFKDLKVWSDQRVIDIRSASEAGQLDPVSLQQLLRGEATERVKKEAEVLGPLQKQYRDYNRVSPVRDVAEQFAATAALNGTPIPGDQLDALVNVMAAHTQPAPSGWLAPQTLDWTATQADAAKLLNPEQLELLRQTQQLRVLGAKLMTIARSSPPK